MEGTLILRLTVAALLGGIIGFDREYRAKEAGLRTHFLVALGSALFMIVSMYGFGEEAKGDPGRVAAQVVTGIGFIGAGSIMIHKQFVRGLTTASGLWATAGIGLAVGGGMYWIGIAAMLLTLAGLELSTLVFKSVGLHTSLLVFSTTDDENLTRVLAQIHEKGYNLVSYEASHETVGDGNLFRVTMVVKTRNYADDTHLFQFMQSLPGLTIEKME
ncbi:MgtC/SapB family protein [Rikenella microfusus]|uniref:MgtC/SapB family protein n=1 Tax=Rikenella microfusus TaxID=28139 RepID=UPI00248DBD99|nr:MgtC/SapB family protein [Rikenella microfusus]